jgi:hypothetical protein
MTVIIFFRLELDGICSDDFKEELLTPTNEDKTEDGLGHDYMGGNPPNCMVV